MVQDQSPEINIHLYGQLVLNKGVQNTQFGKGFFNKWSWETLTLYTKTQSGLKNGTLRPETIKVEGSIGGKLLDISLGTIFLNLTPKPKAIKTVNKWDGIKLKNFCTVKEAITKMKDSLPKGRK